MRDRARISSRARPIPSPLARATLRRARPEARRRDAIRAGKRNARFAINTAGRHRRVPGNGTTPTPRSRLAASRLRIADCTGLTQDDGATIGKRLALELRRLRFVDARPSAGSQHGSEQQYAESNLQGLVRALGSIVFPHGSSFSFDTNTGVTSVRARTGVDDRRLHVRYPQCERKGCTDFFSLTQSVELGQLRYARIAGTVP